MKEKFKDLTSIGVAGIVTTIIGGIFWFFMASILGAEKYGEVTYLISIGIIASTFALAGNVNTLIVYSAKGEKIQTAIFFVSIITSVVVSIILFLIVNNIEIGVYVMGYVIFSLIAAQLQGEKKFRKYAILLITQKILMVGLSVGMFYLIGFQGIIFGIALSFLPYSFILYKEFKKTKIDFSILKKRSGFILAIGTSLHISVVGYEYEQFAREAKTVVIDIDLTSHLKKTIKIDRMIESDARFAIAQISKILENESMSPVTKHCKSIRY